MKASITDIGGAIIWAASAVAVGGYTWDAYKTSYSRFPELGGGGDAAVPPTSKTALGADVQAGIHKLPVVGKILKSSANITGPLLDPTGPYVSAEDVVRLEHLPMPPKALIAKLRSHANARDALAFNREAQLYLQWAKRNGYQNKDAVNYLRYRGLSVTNGLQLIVIARPRKGGKAIRPGR